MTEDSKTPPRAPVSAVKEPPTRYDNDKYFAHLLDQYKIYLEMVDRLSARRVLVNNSFITLMGAGAIAYAAAPQHLKPFAIYFQGGIALACILIAVLWHQTILHYRDLSTWKFKIILEMEELLPAQPYRIEYEKFIKPNEEKRVWWSRGLSEMERALPVLGGVLSLVGLAYAIYNWLHLTAAAG